MDITKAVCTSLSVLWIFLPCYRIAHAFDPLQIAEGKTSSRKALQFYFEARRKGQESEAISVLKHAADQGSPAAQWKLGHMYETGDGIKRNSMTAFEIFKNITEQYSHVNPDSPSGQFVSESMVSLGRYYYKGIPEQGIVADLHQARVMFTTAAMVFRNANAQFELARMNLDEDNRHRDPGLAVHMLKLSSQKGHNGARALLGSMIFEGKYIKGNPVKGLVMMSEARKNAESIDYEWISRLQEDAFALSSPLQRKEAIRKTGEINRNPAEDRMGKKTRKNDQ